MQHRDHNYGCVAASISKGVCRFNFVALVLFRRGISFQFLCVGVGVCEGEVSFQQLCIGVGVNMEVFRFSFVAAVLVLVGGCSREWAQAGYFV